MKRLFRPLLILVVASGSYLFGLLEWFEHELMEMRFRATSAPASTDLVLVEIDEPSLRSLAVWPWPRRYHAEVLQRLVAAGARRIAFDVDFSSPSTSADDRILADALRSVDIPVILPILRQPAQAPDGTRTNLESIPLPAFRSNAVLAAFNVRPDTDGKVRRLFTREQWNDRIVAHYAALIANMHGGALREYYIDFAIDVKSIPRVSFTDVHAGRFDPALFKGRDVLIGSSALQLGDMLTVPVYRALPGIFVQALGYSSLATGRALHRLNPGIVLGLCILVLLLHQIAAGKRTWRHSLPAFTGMTAATILIPLAIQTQFPLYVDSAPLILVVGLNFLTMLLSTLRHQDLALLTQSIALRRRDMFMRLVVENSFDAILTLDAKGIILTQNNAAETVFGYSRDQMAGKNIGKLLPDFRTADGRMKLEDLLEIRGVHEVEGRHQNGRKLILDLSIGHIRLDEDVITTFLARDITGRREAEAYAQEAETRLVEAIESIDAGFALFDADDRMMIANTRFLAKGGVGSRLRSQPTYRDINQALADSGYFITARADPAAWVAERTARHLTADSVTIDQTADGRWILSNARRTHDGGTIVVETDITALKQREFELIRAKDQAESANRTKSEFLAIMGHELRTPLNAIIGFSEMMATEMFGPMGGETYVGYARDILASGKSLLGVINNILDMTKLESGEIHLNEERNSLDDVVANVVQVFEEAAEKKNIAIEINSPDRGVDLLGDAQIIRQIFLHILSNAIKFTPEGGKVKIRQGSLDDGSHEVVIADTGIGMSPEGLKKALEPFGQVESSLSRTYEGTGLGLPLAKRFIALHGGRLEIETVPNGGTQVHVIFPAARVLAPNPSIKETGTA